MTEKMEQLERINPATCQFCQHWRRYRPDSVGGECWRYPPVSGRVRAQTFWNESCGEFELRPLDTMTGADREALLGPGMGVGGLAPEDMDLGGRDNE